MVFRRSGVVLLVAIAVVCVVLAVSTIGVLGAPRGSGRVNAVNVGVYLDPRCTVSCSAIDWGIITPGGTVTQTVYVKNTGSTSVYLQLSTSSWDPVSAESAIDLSWNLRSSYRLKAGRVVRVVLSLQAASDISGFTDFGFRVVISGVPR